MRHQEACLQALRKRRGAGRIMLWMSSALLAVFGGLLLFQVFGKKADRVDPERIRELLQASLAGQGTAPAIDWPGWRGPRRDGVAFAANLRTDWPPQGPPILWEQPTGEGFSSVAVSEGRAFTMLQDGGYEAVVCWKADDGQELWRYRYAAQFRNSFGNGPRSTPMIDGEHLYTVGGAGIMHCLKVKPATSSGEMVWRKDLLAEFQAPIPEWGISFSPLVVGELVFISPGGPGGNSIAALDKLTGALRWKALDDPGGYSSPVAATLAGKEQIVFFTGQALVGVTPDSGALLWRFPWETAHDCNVATPIMVQDYVFLSSGYGRGCAVVKIEDTGMGTFQARPVYENVRLSNHFSSSVRYQDYLFGFNDSILTCMELRTGKVRWKQRGFDKGSLTIAEGQGLLEAAAATTSSAGVPGSGSWQAVAQLYPGRVKAHLIILGENGNLALAEATPEDYREKAQVQISQKKCWTVPVLAQGRLYVRDEARLVCLDVRR